MLAVSRTLQAPSHIAPLLTVTCSPFWKQVTSWIHLHTLSLETSCLSPPSHIVQQHIPHPPSPFHPPPASSYRTWIHEFLKSLNPSVLTQTPCCISFIHLLRLPPLSVIKRQPSCATHLVLPPREGSVYLPSETTTKETFLLTQIPLPTSSSHPLVTNLILQHSLLRKAPCICLSSMIPPRTYRLTDRKPHITPLASSSERLRVLAFRQ